MAGITINDSTNSRIASMWAECGIQFRSNVITEVGGSIPLHVHSYDHIALITHGRFKVREVHDGVKEYEMSPGERQVILAGHQHTFTLIEGELGEVLCMWGMNNGVSAGN